MRKGVFLVFLLFALFLVFIFSRALSTSRKRKKKEAVDRLIKKRFVQWRVFFLILRLTAIKYCYKVSFLHTQEIVLWHFSLIAFVKARFRAIFGCDF